MKMISVPVRRFIALPFLAFSFTAFSQGSNHVEYASISPSNVVSLRGNDALGLENPTIDLRVSKETLKEFTASRGKQGIQLHWQLANQKSDFFFEIQRSVSGGSYVKIASMAPAPDGSYQFTDKTVVQPSYYYRLKMISSEGSIAFSDPLLVTLEKKSGARTISAKRAVAAKKEKNIAEKRRIISLKQSREFSSSLLYFTDQLIFNVEMTKKSSIRVHLSTLRGRISVQREFTGHRGNNEIVVDRLSLLPEGNYTLVVTANGQKFNLMAKK